jgi:hypothetical protein
MKKVSKLMALVFTAMALCFATDVRAQTTPAGSLRMGIGLDAGIPTGNLTISSNFVLGGTIQLQYGISNSFAVTLTSGADHFFSKNNPATNMPYDSFGVIPIKAGVKEFFVPNIYLGIEAGVAIEETDNGVGNKKFAYSPALGYANKRWDVGIRYERYPDKGDPYGFVALRIAYGFAFFTK